MWLVALGAAVGCFGTMIGAGGGFVLVPLLLFFYPAEKPEVITAISLASVWLNASSGTVAYALKKRIDFRSGIQFALASLPGAVVGVLATHQISRSLFDPIFGLSLAAISLFLLTQKKSADPRAFGRATAVRTLKDSDGKIYSYSFNLRLGALLSAVVGFISSFLGIGGGVIHVPALVYLLGFPVHISTATSHFVLAIMAGVGTLEHGIAGSLGPGLDRILFLAPGLVVGSQIGARLSDRVKGIWILRFLAVALLLVGVRLLLQ
jgi:uncharacterized protein